MVRGGRDIACLSTLNHWQRKDGVLEVGEGEERGTNAGNRSNLLLPALYRKTQKPKCTFLLVTF